MRSMKLVKRVSPRMKELVLLGGGGANASSFKQADDEPPAKKCRFGVIQILQPGNVGGSSVWQSHRKWFCFLCRASSYGQKSRNCCHYIHRGLWPEKELVAVSIVTWLRCEPLKNVGDIFDLRCLVKKATCLTKNAPPSLVVVILTNSED